MRTLLFIVLVAIAACGGGTPAPATTPQPDPGGIPLNIDPRVNQTAGLNVTASFAEPVDLVWRALAVAYDSLGIKLGVLDAQQHLMGNAGMQLRAHLSKTMLSKYIDCGSAQIGPSADNYEVILSVISLVRFTESGKTEVVTRVSSSARPPTFGQAYSRCTSKGELERRLAEFVRMTLGTSH